MLASAQRARHRRSRSWGSYGRTGVGPPNASPSPIGAWRLSRSYDPPPPRSCALSFVGWKRKRPPHEAQEAKGGHGVRARYIRRSVPEAATSLIVSTLHLVSARLNVDLATHWALPPQRDRVSAEELAVARLLPWFVPCSVRARRGFIFPDDMAEQPGGGASRPGRSFAKGSPSRRPRR